MNKKLLESVIRRFNVTGDVLDITPLTSGHINTTYCVKMPCERQYTLQVINKYVFKDPVAVMDNILRVTAHIKNALARDGGDVERESLSVVLANNGLPYYLDDDGNYWRLYVFISGAHTQNFVSEPHALYNAGFGFGKFQRMLSDFPIETLHETIPQFHDTRMRYEQLMAAVERDELGRVYESRDEIEFFVSRKHELSKLVELTDSGEMPIRVTHNDTKFNNILIDDVSNDALSVIDLDTVMPGLLVNDFGDAIRYAASTAVEDETDLSKVEVDLSAYKSFSDGFLTALHGMLTPIEFSYLPLGAKIITMELSMRFLTDHLTGDKYFKIHKPGHNLARARCQRKLAQSMEDNFDTMVSLISKYAPCSNYAENADNIPCASAI
ncbi:MAG: aminoglycoside phosphotransferase family protein [Clostridia bacterium]